MDQSENQPREGEPISPLQSVRQTATQGDSDALFRVELFRRMCALITEGAYKPGDRMTERELCERLNASRPSIRETLRQLEAEGLIEIHPNRGAVVRRIDVDTLLKLWEVRLALEVLAVERFARQGRPEQIRRLEDAINAMAAALLSAEPGRIKAAKNEIYDALCAGANNEVLTSHVERLNVRLSFLWSSSLGIPGRPAESIGELRVLVEAIRNHNPDMARSAIILHSDHAKAIAMYALSALDSERSRTRKTTPARKSRT